MLNNVYLPFALRSTFCRLKVMYTPKRFFFKLSQGNIHDQPLFTFDFVTLSTPTTRQLCDIKQVLVQSKQLLSFFFLSISRYDFKIGFQCISYMTIFCIL